MTITRKAALLALAIATVCAIALAGCGSSGATSGASSSAGAAASASSSAASAQQADEQAMQYVGTWKADKLTLRAKSNSSDKETDLDVPVALELNDDMTGTLAVGESTQNVEWEVRHWDNLKVERAVITLHEPFELGNIVCDTESMMLELGDSGSSARFFYDWNSDKQTGVRLSVDMTVEKAS